MEPALIIKRRPYETNWAGNPIVYGFFSEEAVHNNDIIFEIRVLLKTFEVGAAWNQLATIPLTPVSGIATIDISSILNSQLSFIIPDFAGNVTESKKQTGQFYVEYREYNNITGTVESFNTSESEYLRLVIKGGIHPYLWKGNNYWLNYFPGQKPFLTWQINGRLAALTERIYLAWFNTTNIPASKIRYNIVVTYTDSTTTTLAVLLPGSRNRVYYIATGATQLGLPILFPAKNIWFWTIQVQDITAPASPVNISELFKYVNDQRNDYNLKTLLYRNSSGGLDSVRVRGVVETTITLDGADAETATPADWSFNEPLPRVDKGIPNREMPSYKGDIGHLDKKEQDRLRDAFINREVWMELNGRLAPVKLITKQYKLNSTNDKRYSLSIEWMLADAGSFYYTPVDVDLGAGEQLTNVCEGVVGNIQSSISYFAGNTAATVTWQFDVNNTGGETIPFIQYRIPGLIEDWTNFPNPSIANLQTNHAVPKSFTIYFRCLCSSGSYGSITQYNMNIPAVGGGGGTPPANNSTIYNDSSITTYFAVEVNGFSVASGSLAGGSSYQSFLAADAANVNVVVYLGFLSPPIATLKSDGVTYNGAIIGGQIIFSHVNIVNGMVIRFG